MSTVSLIHPPIPITKVTPDMSSAPESKNPAYTSRLSISYSTHSLLNTLDLHHPTTPPLSPSYALIYIHGGAFRDPLVLSPSLIPSLPTLFQNRHVAAIASLNYRLSPHPHHPTHPSSPDDKSRNAKWPEHIDDVRDAVSWLQKKGGMEGECIVAGHSVGGTMAMMLGMEPSKDSKSLWGKEAPMPRLRAVVSIEGIYDFVACRDAHLDFRELYDAFTTGAFGPEEDGGWGRGDILRSGRRIREDVVNVVVAHSKEDELVEWEQAEKMMEVLENHEKGRAVLVELKGKHQEVVTKGVDIAKSVNAVTDILLKGKNGHEP